ncbi:MAG TPA: hypothetical protein DCZ92_15540 [Elusimicrobia bacterium]|nr:hypothetical protein [Elusimicrobiota bacterium]
MRKISLKQSGVSLKPGWLSRGALAFLFVCCAAADSSAIATSTEAVKTDMNALELMSQQMGHSTNKFVQDYMYTGNERSTTLALRAVPAVQADPKAAPVPVAKFTAQAAVIKLDIKGRVPPLAASLGVPGLSVKLGPAPAAPKAAETAAKANSAKTEKAGKKSIFEKIGNWFSDAFAAVKGWISGALTWVRESLVGRKRALTAEETAEMRKVFGDNIDYSKVRIVDGDKLGLWGKILTSGDAAVTWGNTIYFPKGADGKSQYNFNTKAYWLAHEMTHEYQYQKYGWSYVPKSVWGQLTKGQSFYEYQLEGGKGFRKYNVEQQAELVEHYYQIKSGTRTATPEELAIYEQVMKDQGLF